MGENGSSLGDWHGDCMAANLGPMQGKGFQATIGDYQFRDRGRRFRPPHTRWPTTTRPGAGRDRGWSTCHWEDEEGSADTVTHTLNSQHAINVLMPIVYFQTETRFSENQT